MNATRRRLRRPGALLVGEAILLSFVLTATSGLTSVSSVGAFDATDSGTSEAPSASTEPTPVTDPTLPPDPTPTPDPTPSDPPPAPEPTIDPAPTTPPTPDPGASPTPDPAASPAPTEPPASLGLHVDHVWVDAIDRRTGALVAGAIDSSATGVLRGHLYVARFRLVNDSTEPITLRPAIEFGFGESPASWAIVPVVNPVPDVALYSSANVLRGEEVGSATIALEDFRLDVGPAGGPATAGSSNAGVNPGPELTLEPGAFTEVAFVVRATADSAWLATYRVRLVRDGAPVTGPDAILRLAGRPPVVLSPGQRTGVPVDEARDQGSPRVGATAVDGSSWELSAASFTSPHGSYTLTTDLCAACHSSHSASGPLLSGKPLPQSNLCLACHDGSGSSIDVKAQYTDPAVPTNDPGTASWYSHPSTVASDHTSDRNSGEFADRLERHTACADCHQPHRADASLAVQTSAGWTASGALIGASSVVVTNGPAGSSPSYAWEPETTLEYQLCFKCHSGFTELRPQTGGPSTWALDKAVELNPANLSYHPVEAPGTNQSPKLDTNLAFTSTSPYKLWGFTTDSTVRCLNCHGDSRLANPLSPPDPGARLAPHAVTNRGLLIRNLRDRALKSSSASYLAVDFALCYVCHGEAPFVDTSQGGRLDTNFPLHGMHTAGIASFVVGPSGTVDADGAGLGNAICAECHFRTHGTTYAVDQEPEVRLVNFAPNVQPYDDGDPATVDSIDFDATAGTCTLTCHGVPHAGWGY